MARFRLVQVQNDVYAVQDMMDLSSSTFGIECLSREELQHALVLGLEIDGVSRIVGSRDFTYSDEFFIPMDNSEEEEADSVDFESDYSDVASDEEDLDLFDDANAQEEAGYSESEDDSYDDYDDYEEDEDYASEDASDDSALDDNDEEEYYGGEADYSDVEDDYYDDEDEYYDFDDEDYYAQNDKFYKLLSEALGDDKEKLALLSTYYMNRSQVLFASAVQGGTVSGKLVAKQDVTNRQLRKEEALNELRGETGIWTYAGFIDTGYLGGGFCTLGHALRYQHIAIDINQVDRSEFVDLQIAMDAEDVSAEFSANHSRIAELENQGALIRFGIKCLADFFEVDKDTVDELRFLQNQAISEMKELIDIHSEGKEEEVKRSFAFFEEVMDTIIKKDTRAILLGLPTLLTQEEVALYVKFKELGMLYPRSFVRDMREKLTGVPSKPFKRVAGLNYSGKSIKMSVLTPHLTNYFNSLFNGVDLKTLCDVLEKQPIRLNWRSSGLIASSTLASLYIERAFMIGFMGYYRYSDGTDGGLRCVDDGGRSKEVAAYFDYRMNGVQNDLVTVDVKSIPYSVDGIILVNKIYELVNQVEDSLDKINCFWEVGKPDDSEYYVIQEHGEGKFTYARSSWGLSDFMLSRKEDASDEIVQLRVLNSLERASRGRQTVYSAGDFSVILQKALDNTDKLRGMVSDYCRGKAQERCDELNESIRRRLEEEKRIREERERAMEARRLEEEKRLAEQKLERERKRQQDAMEDYDRLKQTEAKEKSREAEFTAQEGRIDEIKRSIVSNLRTLSVAKVVQNLSPADVATLVRIEGNTPEYKQVIVNKLKNGLPLSIADTLANQKNLTPTSRQLYWLCKAAEYICDGMRVKAGIINGVSEAKPNDSLVLSENQVLCGQVDAILASKVKLLENKAYSEDYLLSIYNRIDSAKRAGVCTPAIKRDIDLAVRLLGL